MHNLLIIVKEANLIKNKYNMEDILVPIITFFIMVLFVFSVMYAILDERKTINNTPDYYDWHEYEVISVKTYIETQTNNLGGVINQNICFSFIILDNGELKTIDNYDISDIQIGDVNCYKYRRTKTGREKILVLTKETLKQAYS